MYFFIVSLEIKTLLPHFSVHRIFYHLGEKTESALSRLLRKWNIRVSLSHTGLPFQPSLFLPFPVSCSANSCFVFPQNSLGSVPTLEESSGMDLDAESVPDAKNNLNTARWAVCCTNSSCLDLPSASWVSTQSEWEAALFRVLFLQIASTRRLHQSSDFMLHLKRVFISVLTCINAAFLCSFTHPVISHPQLVVVSRLSRCTSISGARC